MLDKESGERETLATPALPGDFIAIRGGKCLFPIAASATALKP